MKRLFTCTGIILSIIIIILSLQANIFYQNLTYVGNINTTRPLFIIWGILQSIFYYFGYIQFIKREHVYTNNKNRLCLLLCILNVIGILLPYNENRDILSQFHVYANMIACIGAYILVLLFIKDLFKINFNLFNKSMKYIIFIISLSFIILFIFGDINSLLEIVLMIGLNIYFIVY